MPPDAITQPGQRLLVGVDPGQSGGLGRARPGQTGRRAVGLRRHAVDLVVAERRRQDRIGGQDSRGGGAGTQPEHLQEPAPANVSFGHVISRDSRVWTYYE
ncbi:hypothetical protein Abr02nite_72500 [Paractinoplanes brasiliensis]|nr:hypothetical protein Abr02nite_72500 [Actinoplanes brasiliensis]